jgi:hypothetical protein
MEFYDRARAAYQQIKGSRYILTIGVGKTPDSSQALDTADRDASDVAGRLEDETKSLYLVVHRKFIPGRSASFTTIREAFQALAATVRPEDTFEFYYSGSYVLAPPDDKSPPELFLAPADMDAHRPALGGISARLLRTWANRIQAQKQLLIVDCCAPDRQFNQFAAQITDEDGDHNELLAREQLVIGGRSAPRLPQRAWNVRGSPVARPCRRGGSQRRGRQTYRNAA